MRHVAILAFTFAAEAAAAQAQREMGAHQHGHSTLRIAIEGQSVQVELEAPGFDIVSFEHVAETREAKAAVESALAQLERPGELFVFPADADCKLATASVARDDEEDGHEEGHDDHAEHEDDGTHSEFHAEYRFTCGDIDALRSIYFPYFDVFPNAQELDIQAISDTGAGAFEASRSERSVDLSPLL